MEIIFNKSGCIGCGSCSVACPDYWEVGDDGKANLKNSEKKGEKRVLEVEEAGCNKDAANVCPVKVIKIKE